MALTLVQTTPGVSATSASSVTIPFSTPPVAGHGIVLAITTDNTNGLPVYGTAIDNQGNAFTLAVSGVSVSGARARAGIYYRSTLPAVAGAYSVTVTLLTPAYSLCTGFELAGGPLVVAASTALGSSASGTAPSTGTSAASTADDLFLVAVVGSAGGQTAITVETVSPAWTQAYEVLPFTNSTGEVDNRLRTSQLGVTQSASWTFGVAHDWIGVLAAFGGGTPPPARADTFLLLPV